MLTKQQKIIQQNQLLTLQTQQMIGLRNIDWGHEWFNRNLLANRINRLLDMALFEKWKKLTFIYVQEIEFDHQVNIQYFLRVPLALGSH